MSATGLDLTIQQGDLAFAVGKAIGSVSAKSPMPLLSCLLLEAEKGSLRVTGTDLEITTAVTVPCTVRTPGKAAVSARHFHEVVRKVPRGETTLSSHGDQVAGHATETERAGRGSRRRMPPSSRACPTHETGSEIAIEGEVLARLVARSGYAASTDAHSATALRRAGSRQRAAVDVRSHRWAPAGS